MSSTPVPPGGQSSPGGTGVPVCPRHPDRVSYVRCQRCGRPMCGDCQRAAPVGFQCVDCVRQAASAQPAVRTALGGRVRTRGQIVTTSLIGINVVAYLAALLVPAVYGYLAFTPAIGYSEPYRFVTTAFLHSGFLHLALNMYALYVVGTLLEPILGRWRFLALYLVSAVGGSVAVLLLAGPLSQTWLTATVGASGAVFGLFAACFFVLRRFGRDVRSVAVVLLINFVLGFVVANISWQAHLGGVVTGAVLAAAYAYAPKKSRTVVGVLATVLLVVVLAVAAYLRYSTV